VSDPVAHRGQDRERDDFEEFHPFNVNDPVRVGKSI